MYKKLPKIYKKKFPFKISCPSFIYKDDYIPNIKMLGPFMDEIELLLFEAKDTDFLPSKKKIIEMGELGKKFDLSYNVHLPTDLSVTSPDKIQREITVESVKYVIDLTKNLDPSTYTLHLPCNSESMSGNLKKNG